MIILSIYMIIVQYTRILITIYYYANESKTQQTIYQGVTILFTQSIYREMV